MFRIFTIFLKPIKMSSNKNMEWTAAHCTAVRVSSGLRDGFGFFLGVFGGTLQLRNRWDLVSGLGMGAVNALHSPLCHDESSPRVRFSA